VAYASSCASVAATVRLHLSAQEEAGTIESSKDEKQNER